MSQTFICKDTRLLTGRSHLAKIREEPVDKVDTNQWLVSLEGMTTSLWNQRGKWKTEGGQHSKNGRFDQQPKKNVLEIR